MFNGNPLGKKAKGLTALTGGLGSGKTTAAREFKRLGADIIDCDALSHHVCARGKPALKKIEGRFGREVFRKDGSLNRAKLGKIVFADKAKRRALERIIHPYVIREAVKKIKALKNIKTALIDVPLLFEAGLDRFVGKVVVVWLPARLQAVRLSKRDNLKQAEIAERLRAQLSLSAKKKKADYVIDNSRGISHTRKQVKRIWEVLTKESK